MSAASSLPPPRTGDGPMAARLRGHDGSTTPRGPAAGGSPALHAAVGTLLGLRLPAVLVWGPSHLAVSNDAYAASLGPGQPSGLPGRPAAQAFGADTWALLGPRVEAVLAGGRPTWPGEPRVSPEPHDRREDVRWTFSGSPVPDETVAGGIGGVLVLCLQTPPGVRECRALQAEQALWQAMFDQAPGFLAVLEGPDHRWRHANPAFQALVGRSGESLPGRAVADVLPEFVEQGLVALLDRVYRTGEPFRGEGVPVRIVGPAPGRARVHRVDFVCQPLRDAGGAVHGLLVQGTDVTDRVEVQRRLADTNRALQSALLAKDQALQRLSAATEAAELGIYRWEVESGRLEWDARVRRLWGAEPADPVDHGVFLDRIHPEDRALVQARLDRAIDPSGDGRFQAEFRVAVPERPVRVVRATGQVDFVGECAVALVGTVQDVTEDRAVRAALAESDRLKDVFLATLSHELRNPLAPIRSAAAALAQPGLDGEGRERARRIIERQAAHMARLLDDILDVVRITQGKMALHPRPLPLAEVIDHAVEVARPAIEARQQRLAVDRVPPAVRIVADPDRLTQVFSNLLTNAAKFTPEGGRITLTVDAPADDPQVAVTVHDDGVGIPAEAQAGIFDMFGQGHGRSSRAKGGLGIGLSLARGLVDLHGGGIEVRSEGHGRGSAFTVRLPRASPAPSGPVRDGAGDTAGRPATHGRRVLVVDDNRDSADMLATWLALQGHAVEVAYDGLQALRRADECRPEVVVLDIGLPDVDGHDVARRLRRTPWASGVRLVALTGWGQPADKARAAASGFDGHLTKPVDPQVLSDWIDRAPAGPGR